MGLVQEISERYIEDFSHWERIPKGAVLCFYGAAEGGSNLKVLLEKIRSDLKVICYIDDFVTGQKDGLSVYTLDDFVKSTFSYDYICVTAVFPEKIIKNLQNYGLDNFLIIDSYFTKSGNLWERLALSFSERVQRYAWKNERIPYDSECNLPEIPLKLVVGSSDEDGNFFNIVDFEQKNIDRYFVPFVEVSSVYQVLKDRVPVENLPVGLSHRAYIHAELSMPHVCHLSSEGEIWAPSWNGLFVYVIDSTTGEVAVFPDNYEEELYRYSGSGSFSPDGKYWYFLRWPFEDSMNVLNGEADRVTCEIGKVCLADRSVHYLYDFNYTDEIHQVTCSPDDRYLVFTTFSTKVRLPYPPDKTIDEDPDGYARSHKAGIDLISMMTIDMKSGEHWLTEIPVPTPGHFEFDPVDPHVFYVSAHNSGTAGPIAFHAPVLEGPGTIFKMRIGERETIIEDSYSDEIFYRIFQHMPFVYKGKTYIAVATSPNKLDLLDAETMTLWRRITLFDADLPDLSKTGNAPVSTDPGQYLCVNPSRDGRYIVMGSCVDFCVYSVDEDRVLDEKLVMPEPNFGRGMVGHTRTVGL